MSISICFLVITLLTIFQEEVVAQVLPPYGGAPISYISNEDDDLGMLLTILLLAGRNKGGGCSCCNCCNCGSAQNIPIPYPIPFPTNNPIVNRGTQDGDYDDDDDSCNIKSNKDDKIYIDIVSPNDD